MKNKTQQRQLKKAKRAKRHEQQMQPLRHLLQSMMKDYCNYLIRQGEEGKELCTIYMKLINHYMQRGGTRTKLKLLWGHINELLELLDGTMITEQTNQLMKELLGKDLQMPSGEFPLDIRYMVGFMVTHDKPIFFEYNNIPVELGHPLMAFLSHIDVKKHLSGESGKIIIDCEKQTISIHGFKDHDYLMAVLDEQEALDDIYHFAWLRNFIANGGTYYGPTSKLIA